MSLFNMKIHSRHVIKEKLSCVCDTHTNDLDDQTIAEIARVQDRASFGRNRGDDRNTVVISHSVDRVSSVGFGRAGDRNAIKQLP